MWKLPPQTRRPLRAFWTQPRFYEALVMRGYAVARVDVRGTGGSQGVTVDEYTLEEQLEAAHTRVRAIVRDEAYYFAPQGMTKVMNEGWASFWHSTLMTKHFVESKEIIDYADHHSGTVHMPPGNFNPYKIGLELFRDIEDRWNKGKFGKEYEEAENLGEKKRWDRGLGQGREKIFEVRRIYNDVNFIDEFLTPEFVEKHQMYQFRRDHRTGEVRVVSRDFRRVKQTLLAQLTNMGQPFVYVVDANYLNRGELYLAHRFTGVEIDAARAAEVLRALCALWGRPVHLPARINEETFLTSVEEPRGEIKREKITELWVWGASGMHMDELAMRIPNRYARFGPTDNPWFYRPYDIPEELGRTTWVMGFNYEVGPDNMIHSYVHRIESMAALVRKHSLPEALDALDVSFSTSGPVERAARAFVLLDAFQAFFDETGGTDRPLERNWW